MTKTITFNELRRIKDRLPDGSMHRIADELGLQVETVRNYFGGQNFQDGRSCGIHIEPGPDGGLVVLDDTTIFEREMEIMGESASAEEPLHWAFMKKSYGIRELAVGFFCFTNNYSSLNLQAIWKTN